MNNYIYIQPQHSRKTNRTNSTSLGKQLIPRQFKILHNSKLPFPLHHLKFKSQKCGIDSCVHLYACKLQVEHRPKGNRITSTQWGVSTR